MKKDQKRVGIYREKDLTPILIKDELWRLIFTPLCEHLESRALGERAGEHSKSTTSAILKHCKDFHHLLPSISDFSIIDKDPSQITREAKEAIHIRRLDPNLNRNIGKMSIPHCFDPLIGAKPKHPWVGALSQMASQPVDEIAPPSQIPGLNLTQFNNIGIFRPNVAQHIPKPSKGMQG